MTACDIILTIIIIVLLLDRDRNVHGEVTLEPSYNEMQNITIHTFGNAHIPAKMKNLKRAGPAQWVSVVKTRSIVN